MNASPFDWILHNGVLEVIIKMDLKKDCSSISQLNWWQQQNNWKIPANDAPASKFEIIKYVETIFDHSPIGISMALPNFRPTTDAGKIWNSFAKCTMRILSSNKYIIQLAFATKHKTKILIRIRLCVCSLHGTRVIFQNVILFICSTFSSKMWAKWSGLLPCHLAAHKWQTWDWHTSNYHF